MNCNSNCILIKQIFQQVNTVMHNTDRKNNHLKSLYLYLFSACSSVLSGWGSTKCFQKWKSRGMISPLSLSCCKTMLHLKGTNCAIPFLPPLPLICCYICVGTSNYPAAPGSKIQLKTDSIKNTSVVKKAFCLSLNINNKEV